MYLCVALPWYPSILRNAAPTIVTEAGQGFTTQDPSSEGSAGVTDTTIPVSFVIPEELNANGPIMRFRVVVRVYGSNVETLSTWYTSFHHTDRETSPPYQAVEEVISDSTSGKRHLRQTQVS